MKKYDISNYDKYACLKVNDLMLLIGAYLLKPYIIAAASVAYRKDRSAIINIFYANKMIVSFEAAAAIPLLFLIYAWTRKTPDASQAVQNIWKNGKQLITATAILQLCVTASPLWLPINISMTRISWVQLLLYLLVIVITYYSTYMKDCFADFPVPNKDNP